MYSGQVQGVGFRFTVEGLASYLGIKGFVRNLADGRVEVVCEGDDESMDAFLARIDERMGAYISDRRIDRQEATDEFASFEVRF